MAEFANKGNSTYQTIATVIVVEMKALFTEKTVQA